MAKDQPGRNGQGIKGDAGPATATPAKGGPQPGSRGSQAADPPKNKPVHEIRMGRICGAIWLQHGNDGQTWHNVTLSRIYRDNDGNWQRSDSFGRTDLPLVAKVADLCHTWVYHQGQAQEDNG